MKLIVKILFLYCVLLCTPGLQAQVNFNHSPSRLKLFPRNANDSADVVLDGQVTQSNYDKIIFTYYKDNVISDSTIVNLSFSGGNNGSFSKTYRIKARKSLYSFRVFLVDNNISTRVFTADSVVCGDVFIINGQSNATANPTSGGTTDAPYLWLRSFGNPTATVATALADTTWGLAQGTSGSAAYSIGVWGIRLGKMIADEFNIPICIINGARSGTEISLHLPAANPLTSSTYYGRLLYRAQKAEVDQKVKAIFWFQGESDGGSADAPSYLSRFATLHNAWNNHFPALKKIFVVQTHPGCIDDMPEHSIVRESIRKFPNSFSDVRLMSTVGLAGFDGCHFNIPGYQSLAANLEDLVARDVYNVSVPGNIDPPDIVSAYYSNGTNTEISLVFNQQIFWPANYNGYNLKDYFYFNTAVTVVSGSASGNIVKLTFAASSNATKITYIPNQYYNNSTTISYNGPWLLNDNDLGAFTFFEFPITTGLAISSSTTSLCGTSSVLMISNKTGTNYKWYRNGNQIAGATSSSYSATQSGNYYLTLVDASSTLLTSNTLGITSGISAPILIAEGGPFNFCPGSNVALSTSLAYSSYLWSNGQTTSIISVSTAGNFSVSVTNSQGCTAISSVSSVTQFSTPVASINAPSNGVCTGSTLSLTASNNISYMWSTGATSQSINVSNGGTFTVTITDNHGCTLASAPIVISSYALPTATISSPATSFCEGNSLTLTSSAGSSYLWSNSATSQSILTTVGGTFTVTVTGSNGCSKTSNASIITKNTLPVAIISSSGTGFCPGSSLTLNASGGNIYLWSTGASTAGISTNAAGNFTVTVTDINGCTDASDPINIIQYTSPTSIISASKTSFCNGDSVQLSVPANNTYLWSTNATSQNIYINNSGVFTVTVSDIYGCSSVSSPVSLTKNTPTIPTISYSSVNFCNGDSLLLSASTGSSYSWSSGQASKNIYAYASGNYYVIVTDNNGCTAASDPLSVTKRTPAVPTILYTTTSICTGDSLQLLASSGSSFLWSNGKITQGIYVKTGGNYFVTTTDNFGCSAVSTHVIIIQDTPAIPTILHSKTAFCAGDSLLLTATIGNSYLWSNGATTQNIYAINSGTFAVTVGDNAGCAAVSPALGITKNIPTIPNATAPKSIFCEGEILTLSASYGNAFLWSTGETTQSINTAASGTYFVTVTDNNGCTVQSSPVTINKDVPQVPAILSLKSNVCNNESLKLSASYGSTFLWSTGETTADIFINNAGNYSVSITDSYGCSAISSLKSITKINPGTPVISGAGFVFCQGDSLLLNATLNNAYNWSTGATTQSIYLKNSGTFTVTVANSYGCTAVSSPAVITTNIPVVPTISSMGSGFCDGDSLLLTASPGVSCLWSTGATTQSIYSKNSGSFVVTVRDNNGCAGVSVPAVVVKNSATVPIINASSTNFCAGDSFLLSASLAASYLWSNGNTTQQIYTEAGGTYTVTIRDANGCSAVSNPITLSANTPIIPSIFYEATSFCQGSSLMLSASNGIAYLWSNGATTQLINTDTAGQYTVIVTDIHGCSAISAPVAITKNIPVIPVINSANTSFCNGDSVLLTSSLGSFYLWSTGATTQQIYSKVSGNYIVTVTDINGCFIASNPYNITKNTPPPAVISAAALSFCQGDSMLITASGGNSYLWSTGSTVQNIYVKQTGVYNVSITDNNNCVAASNSLSITKNIISPPSINANGFSFCSGASLTLIASQGSTFLWSTGETTQGINVTNGGSYSVTITDNHGCSANAVSGAIIKNTAAIPVINSSGSGFCSGDSMLLASSSGVSFAWSTGSTIQNVYAVNTGSYIVTVTDINGCTAVSLPKSITKFSLPVSLISSSSVNFCDGSSLTLNASQGNSYLWSTGAVTQSINTVNSGTFTVRVTDANGCSSISSPLSVTKYAPVNITILSSGTNFCAGDSLLLATSNGISFLWSTGANTQNVYVRESGSFVVTITDNHGCTGVSLPLSVTKNTSAIPTITSNGTTFCNGSSLMLTASAGNAYLWSNGATTQSLSVTNSGVFTVSVTNSLGCSAPSAPKTVTKNTPVIPGISSSGTTFCDGSSLLLTASAGNAYLWSNGITTQSISTTNSGTFTVTVTNSSGCSAISNPITVTKSTPAIPIISSAGTTFCNGSTLLLTASAGNSYLWSTGETTQSTSASNSGTFTVTVTNIEGCSAVSAPLTITRNTPAIPTISSAGTTFCNGSTLVLTSTSGITYLWSSGATTQSISASNSSTFTVTVTNSSGCSAVSAPITVTRNTPTTPTISSAGTTFCNGSTLLLTASSGNSYLWSNGTTTQIVSAINSGTFTVTVTNSFGCTAVSAPITVTRNTPTTPIISSAGTTFCNGSTLSLNSSSGSSYLWSSGATTQNISVTNSGTFTVTVTNSSGCSAASAPITVTRNTPAIPTISSTATIFCAGDSLQLSASSGSAYLWSNGAITQNIFANNSGSFTVTVTNSSGCSAVSALLTVTRNTPTTPVISSTGTTFCNGSTLLLTASSGSSYLWSSGATTQNISAVNTGTFTVTVTNSSSCSAVSAPLSVSRITLAVPVISTTGTAFCNGDSLLLSSSSSTSYLWSSGATTQNIYSTNTGTFTVTITNSQGCTAVSAPITVTRNTPATPTISSAGTTFCNGSSLLLTSSAGTSYLWSSGVTTQSITVTNSGTFTVTVTNSSGCSAVSAPITVTRNTPSIPTISSAGTSFCNGSSMLLTSSAGSAYLWSNGITTQSISTSNAGTFTVTVTNSSGCSAVSVPIIITRVTPATPTISSAGTTFCNGSSLTLTSSSGTSYLWSNGAVTQAISPTNSGTFTVTVTYSSGCAAASSPLVITRITPAVPTINSTGTAFCSGDSILLTSSAGNSYLWSTGATTQSLYSASSATFTVTVTNSSGCSAVSNSVTVIRSTPVVPLINSTATSFCDGDSLKLTASYGNTFVWSTGGTTASVYTLSAGTFTVTVSDSIGCKAQSTGIVITKLTIALPVITGPASLTCEGSAMTLTAPTNIAYLWSTGATTKTISTAVAGGYTVTVTNTNGCSRKSNVYQATYSPAPTGTISPTGTATICSGNTLPMSATSAVGNTFQWYKGNSVITGATLSTYSGTSAGTYKVRYTNPQGCTSYSATCTIAFSALPAASFVATNQANNCSDTVVTLTANAGTLFTYQWQKDLVNIPAATAQVYTTNAKASFRVIVSNQYGCSKIATALSIPIPIITATYTASGSTIICTGDSVVFTANTGTGYLYQWQKNNANIAGATLKSYAVKTSGSYRVVVTNAMGCSSIAKTTVVTVNNCAREYSTEAISEEANLKINIYPNPTMNSFTIESQSTVNIPVQFEIQDISGRVVKYGKMDFSEGAYHLGEDLHPGIYLFRAVGNGVRRNYRIEKIAE